MHRVTWITASCSRINSKLHKSGSKSSALQFQTIQLDNLSSPRFCFGWPLLQTNYDLSLLMPVCYEVHGTHLLCAKGEQCPMCRHHEEHLGDPISGFWSLKWSSANLIVVGSHQAHTSILWMPCLKALAPQAGTGCSYFLVTQYYCDKPLSPPLCAWWLLVSFMHDWKECCMRG